ncbi:MAG: Ig-like domain-containing protein [Planctomycetota bacterium]
MPPRRRLVFIGLTALLLYAAVEGLAFATHWARSGQPFSFAIAGEALRAARVTGREPERPAFEQGVVLHPYLGFVSDPTRESGPRRWNAHGFLGVDGPVLQRAPHELIVAVCGGSVALQFFEMGTSALEARLRALPAFANRRLRFVSLAAGGFKQPQQLMALSYVHALGGEFDLVINLDGFNEIALPVIENQSAGVHPLFPRGWRALAAATADPRLLRRIGAVEAMRQRRRESASWVADTPLRYSVLANVLWGVFDRERERAIGAAQASLFRRRDVLPFSVRGPLLTPRTREDPVGALVDAWSRSSLQMDRLCRANGAHYVHCLQPNQYDPGSKRLTAREREVAYRDDAVYRDPVGAGYPRLREAGAILQRRGVAFVDLSMLFADLDETVYQDDCCHFNRRGHEVVARAIGDAVAPAFADAGAALPDVAVQALSSAPQSCRLSAPLQAQALSIRARFADGGERDVTYAGTTFRSSDPLIATVSAAGVVTARRPGTATVTARRGALAAEVAIEVAFERVVRYGVGVPAYPELAPTLRVGRVAPDRVELIVERLPRGMSATLLGAIEPGRSQLCDVELLVPVADALAVPLAAEGGRAVYWYELLPEAPPTTFWQVMVRDRRGACHKWTSNGLAVTMTAPSRPNR